LRPDDPLTVQLVAVPATGQALRTDEELTLEEIELIVSPVRIRAKQETPERAK
jgi:hypothetical protein